MDSFGFVHSGTGAVTGAATLTSSGAAAVSNAANVGGLLSTSGGATTICSI